jgi:adenylate cyclase, class 2
VTTRFRPRIVTIRRLGVIEAELKARVRDLASLRARLLAFAVGESSVYHDSYYDWSAGDLSIDGRELRLRLVDAAGRRSALLTYKEPAVESVSGSKPECETQVEDPSAIDIMLRGLGLECILTFEKHCTNYRFAASGRQMLATVVQVPELDGTFIEVETMARDDDTSAALADVRALLNQLGVADDDLTSEKYTDAVLKARQQGQA